MNIKTIKILMKMIEGEREFQEKLIKLISERNKAVQKALDNLLKNESSTQT